MNASTAEVLSKLTTDMGELSESFAAIHGKDFSAAIGLLANQAHTLALLVEFAQSAVLQLGTEAPPAMVIMSAMLPIAVGNLQRRTLGYVFETLPEGKHSELVKCLEVTMASISKAQKDLVKGV